MSLFPASSGEMNREIKYANAEVISTGDSQAIKIPSNRRILSNAFLIDGAGNNTYIGIVSLFVSPKTQVIETLINRSNLAITKPSTSSSYTLYYYYVEV